MVLQVDLCPLIAGPTNGKVVVNFDAVMENGGNDLSLVVRFQLHIKSLPGQWGEAHVDHGLGTAIVGSALVSLSFQTKTVQDLDFSPHDVDTAVASPLASSLGAKRSAEFNVVFPQAKFFPTASAAMQQVFLDDFAVTPLIRTFSLKEDDGTSGSRGSDGGAFAFHFGESELAKRDQFPAEFAVRNLALKILADDFDMSVCGGSLVNRSVFLIPAGTGKPAFQEIDVELAVAESHYLNTEFAVAFDFTGVFSLDLVIRPSFGRICEDAAGFLRCLS